MVKFFIHFFYYFLENKVIFLFLITKEHVVAHLEEVPAITPPESDQTLKTRPSFSFRLALVLDMGLAFAKS